MEEDFHDRHVEIWGLGIGLLWVLVSGLGFYFAFEGDRLNVVPLVLTALGYVALPWGLTRYDKRQKKGRAAFAGCVLGFVIGAFVFILMVHYLF